MGRLVELLRLLRLEVGKARFGIDTLDGVDKVAGG